MQPDSWTGLQRCCSTLWLRQTTPPCCPSSTAAREVRAVPPACRRAGRWPLSLLFCTDCLSPASLSGKFLKCMSLEVSLDYVNQELVQDPTPLHFFMNLYTKFAREAKQERAPGDPWPVIIIDEANDMQEWEDAKALSTLLKFFVYLTKQEKLAHVVLATSDTFLTQWLQSGVLPMLLFTPEQLFCSSSLFHSQVLLSSSFKSI